MLDIMLIALLAVGAVLLNSYAATVADRSSARRALLEDGWAALIAARRG